MSIKQKINNFFIITVIVSILSFLGYNFFLYYKIHKINQQAAVLQSNTLKIIDKISEMELAVAQTQQYLQDISATRGAPGFDSGFEEAETWSKTFYSDYNYLKTIPDNKLKEKLEQVKTNYDEFYEKGKHMANLYIKEGPDSGNQEMKQMESLFISIEKNNFNDEEIILFLKNWLITHIKGIDKEYGQLK